MHNAQWISCVSTYQPVPIRGSELATAGIQVNPVLTNSRRYVSPHESTRRHLRHEMWPACASLHSAQHLAQRPGRRYWTPWNVASIRSGLPSDSNRGRVDPCPPGRDGRVTSTVPNRPDNARLTPAAQTESDQPDQLGSNYTRAQQRMVGISASEPKKNNSPPVPRIMEHRLTSKPIINEQRKLSTGHRNVIRKPDQLPVHSTRADQ